MGVGLAPRYYVVVSTDLWTYSIRGLCPNGEVRTNSAICPGEAPHKAEEDTQPALEEGVCLLEIYYARRLVAGLTQAEWISR